MPQLVDANGALVYAGRTGNAKYQALVAQGLTTVSEPYPATGQEYLWNGAAWIAQPLDWRTGREREYPPLQEQLEAIWAYLDDERSRAGGRPLPPAVDSVLNKIIAAQTNHPKPAV